MSGTGLADRVAESVERLTSHRTAGRRLGITSLIVTQGSDRFEALFAGDEPVDLRSISKVALAAAVGVAIARGESLAGTPLDLGTRAVELFAQAPAALPRPPVGWGDITVGHLINCTIGHDEGFLFRRDLGDRDPYRLVDYAFGQPLTHPPGEHFAYSNVGPFLMSVLVQELTGQPLSGWVADRVFAPLGIAAVDWRRYGRYDAGGTGLALRPRELHDLADLFRRGGTFHGKRVLSTGWLVTMTSPSIPTPGRSEPGELLPKHGYGYGMWTCGDGRYFCDGTDGQFLVVDPARDLAITTLADEPDMTAIRRCLTPLLARPKELPAELPRPRVPG